MEARSLTAGHNTLVKIVRALIERCVADGQQLLEWSRRNRATAPSSWTPSVPPLSMSDHTGSHRLDIRPHPDDTHPGLQLRIIEDFGFREHPVLCTSLLPIDDADALAAMQYEYQTVSKDVRAVEEKLGALLTTVRRRNPALLVWLHDRFRVVMEGAGKPVFHEEFRYGADE